MSWMERQGQVGDLRNRSKEELQDLLLRQHRILNNRRLLQTLPDKGKKIEEFAEKIRLAIEQISHDERRRSTVSDARAELQSMHKQAFAVQRLVASSKSAAGQQNQEGDTRNAVHENTASTASPHVLDDTRMDEQQHCSVSSAATVDTMVMAAEPSMNSDGATKSLVKALERVTLDETGAETEEGTVGESYSIKEKKPHYVTVLEKTEKSAASRKQKFKPNQLLHGGDITSPGSLSPTHSSEGSSPLSLQARRERDRKHLNDITAAKLPPLRHSPAQLVSLEESTALLKEHTKKQQELQAKMAAQKLSEGLKMSMGSYTPDESSTASYREVHDEGAELSSDDD
ncbi:protein GRINL1A [Gouania willdenowi]|uniref:RNA polymerase II subunit M n=1 Tax=Gouania willdenowi TaxID=441366 RepID=A0A8C5I7R9_GOUWI|nr:protein GRINL1A [Gouania willdenowi]